MFGLAQSGRDARRRAQVCRQIEERLGLVLAGELEDPLLAALTLVAVEPDPLGPNVVVVVALPPGALTPEDARRRLERLRPFLRAEAAAAIHRKRAPELLFRVVAQPGEEVDA